MAHTLTDYWYTLKPNQAAALIGEDHQGEWTRTPEAETAVERVAVWHKQKKKTLYLWHEGETSAISSSFKAFGRWFATKYSLRVQVKQWEPTNIRYTREQSLLMGLMAGDATQTTAHLGLGGIYMEELLRSDSWKASPTERYTEDEILKLVDKGKHAKRYRELLYSPITKKVLDEWFTLREEAFEDANSRLYPIMSAPQWAREDWLGGLLKSQSGIFLVGESHIGTMRGRGLISGNSKIQIADPPPDYGKTIFAPHRLGEPPPHEPNTPEEEAAWAAFQKHYFGGKDDSLNALVDDVLAARDSGWYGEYLTVPGKYRRAFRVINDIPAAVAKGLVPSFPQDGKAWGWAAGGVYKPHKGRVNSWTVSTSIFKKLLKDFGGAFYRRNPGAYHLVLVVNLDAHRKRFFMNPDSYHISPKLAGEFSYQQEIISVDNIPLVGAAYCRHDEFGGDDSKILQKLLSMSGK